MKLTHGSLFSGIGGFDLGFDWTERIETIWQVENNDYCLKVLAKHWFDVERFEDIRNCGRHNLKEVDIISGGFPCTGFSTAGKQRGFNDEGSGLWSEMYRIIRELRPRYTVIENVPNLIRLGLEQVLCDLTEIGYDAEWQVIGADDIGAPHRRKRIWVVAYPQGTGRFSRASEKQSRGRGEMAYSSSIRCDGKRPLGQGIRWQNSPCDETRKCSQEVADSDSERSQGYGKLNSERECACSRTPWACCPAHEEERLAQSGIRRISHGVPARVDRLKGLGNAIIPQIAEIIGRMIIEAEGMEGESF